MFDIPEEEIKDITDLLELADKRALQCKTVAISGLASKADNVADTFVFENLHEKVCL